MIKKEHIAAKIVRDLTWHFTGKDKELFLTFDDGPTKEITPWVLEILKEYNAKATFFCIGKNVIRYPEIFNRILQDGHSVGNHSYSHFKGWFIKNKKYYENIEKAAKLIKSDLFRPPYGKIGPFQVPKLRERYKIVMWDVLSRDYDSKMSKERCLEYVLDYAESGSIIVFHDTKKAERNLKYVLPEVLRIYSEAGFTFNAIEYSKPKV